MRGFYPRNRLSRDLYPLTRRYAPTSPRKRGEVKWGSVRGMETFTPYPFTSCFSDAVAGLPLAIETRT